MSPGTPPARALPAAGWRELFLWLVGRRRRYRVSGSSMLPLLEDSGEVLVDPRGNPRPGDVVVARHPYRRSAHVLKLLEGIDERGAMRLIGTNPGTSTDSRSFGNVPGELLRGRVSSTLRTREVRS